MCYHEAITGKDTHQTRKDIHMKTVICYKVRKSMFNCDHFLAYYTNMTLEQGQAEAEKLNTEKPEKLFNGQPIDWNNVLYFYADQQEEMY